MLLDLIVVDNEELINAASRNWFGTSKVVANSQFDEYILKANRAQCSGMIN